MLQSIFDRGMMYHIRFRRVCRREYGLGGKDMTTAQFCIIAAIVIYLIAMVYVGFYFSRKGSGASSNEFYLGGRKLGPIVTAMSAEASDMSSWLLMGLPGWPICAASPSRVGPLSAWR